MALPVAYEAISPAEKPRTRSMMRMRAMAIAFGVAMVACVALLAAGTVTPPPSLGACSRDSPRLVSRWLTSMLPWPHFGVCSDVVECRSPQQPTLRARCSEPRSARWWVTRSSFKCSHRPFVDFGLTRLRRAGLNKLADHVLKNGDKMSVAHMAKLFQDWRPAAAKCVVFQKFV